MKTFMVVILLVGILACSSAANNENSEQTSPKEKGEGEVAQPPKNSADESASQENRPAAVGHADNKEPAEEKSPVPAETLVAKNDTKSGPAANGGSLGATQNTFTVFIVSVCILLSGCW